MSSEKPTLNQVNLVVEDMDAAVAFYQALGMQVRFDGGEWPAGSGARHVALDNGEGAIFELDNLAMARIYHVLAAAFSAHGSAALHEDGSAARRCCGGHDRTTEAREDRLVRERA